MQKTIAAAMTLVILIGFVFVGTAYATQKSLNAEIKDKTASINEYKLYDLTVTNDDLNPKGNKLGSATINIPPGFRDVSITNISPTNWQYTLESDQTQKTIKLTAPKSADCIKPGEDVIVSFWATAPENPGHYVWNTIAYTSPSWAGDLFTLTSDNSLLTVEVTLPPKNTVNFEYQIDPSDAVLEEGSVEVTYKIGTEGEPTTKALPFKVEVYNNAFIYYNYTSAVSDISGNLYSITSVIPTSPQQITANITVTGYFEKTFGITASSGDPINATTERNLNPTILGLLPFPDGAVGFYYLVSINEFSPGTFSIVVNYGSGMDDASEESLRLYMSDPVDFNGDGTVDGNDVNMTQAAIRNGGNDLTYDINHDGVVDKIDLQIVQEYSSKGLLVPTPDGGQMRLPWLDITTGIDVKANEIYGETDHFSGFGVHR